MFVTTLKRNVLCTRNTSKVPVWSVYLCFRFLSRMCSTVSGNYAVSHFMLTYQKAHVCLSPVLHYSNDQMYLLNARR